MAWTLSIQAPEGGADLATNVSFKSLKLSWSIDGPGSAEIDLNPADVTTYWRPGLHRVVARLDSSNEFAGILSVLERSGPPGNLDYKASAQGLAGWFDWRIVRRPFEIVDTTDAIVTELLDESQTQLSGTMGMAMGTTTGTFPSRRRTYCKGMVLADAINELASIGRGFDWEVDGDGDLNLWAPARGTDTALTLTEADVQDWSVTDDTSEMLTIVTALGDSNRPWGPIGFRILSGLQTTYRRREIAVDVDSSDPDDVKEAGQAALYAQTGARVRVHVMWVDDLGPWGWRDVWLGDRVDVALPDFFGSTTEMRVIEVSITLEPGTHTFTEYTFEALVADVTVDEGDD